MNLIAASRVLIFPWTNHHACQVVLGRPAGADLRELPYSLVHRCNAIAETWIDHEGRERRPDGLPAYSFVGPAWVIAAITCWWQMTSERPAFEPLVTRLDAVAYEAMRLWHEHLWAVEADADVEVALDRGAVEAAGAIVAAYHLAETAPPLGLLRELLLSMGPP